MSDLSHPIEQDAWQVFINLEEHLKTLKGKRVLVTGGTGIIGLYIMAVLGFVDKAYGLRGLTYTSLSDYNIRNRIVSEMAKHAVWMQADLSSHDSVNALPPCDVLFHVAGYGQPPKFMAHPLDTVLINTAALIQLARNMGFDGQILYASSSEIYSGNSFVPHLEGYIGTTTPQHARAPYIEAKRCGEAISTVLNETDRKVRVARISLSYGPGTAEGDGRVINQFIYQALCKGGIQCKDSGLAGRTYIYIQDCVEMLFSVLLRGRHPVYNVAGMSDISIRKLAEAIATLTNTKATFPDVVSLGDTAAPPWVKSDISLYRNEFKKDKFVDMVDGLTRTINWQKILYGQVQ